MIKKYFKNVNLIFLLLLVGCSSSDYDLINNGALTGTTWKMTEVNILNEDGTASMKLDVYGYQEMLFSKHGGTLSVRESDQGEEQYIIQFESNLVEDSLYIKYEGSNEEVEGKVNLNENRINIRYNANTLKGGSHTLSQREDVIENSYYEEVYQKVQSNKR